jgi:YgiT-type zinc finger domain-containing protein
MRMICPTCKIGNLKPGRTFYTQMINNTMVVIKNVPALICDTCGEEVLKGTQAKKIEEHLKAIKNNSAELEVINYEKF